MVTTAELQGQVGICAARQAIAPAGIPYGVAVLRLQAARLRGIVCRPSPLDPHHRQAGHGSVLLFALDIPPNASAGGFVITCSPRDQMPMRMKHRLPRRLT